MKIPFFSFDGMHTTHANTFKKAFSKVLESGWLVLGQHVSDFEQAYAQFSGTNYCIGVANGLDALHLSLKALGIGPGDEVIVPSNTYIATWLAISYVGGTIVPVEPNPLTHNIDPDRIEEHINSRTKVIMPVHLFGQACRMDQIMDIATKHGLWVVEDNAQSQGASCADQVTGSFGILNGTSFYPTKNLGALGDGGAITTNNADLAEQCRMLRNYGSPQKYINHTIGHNSRLDEVQAALLRPKLNLLKDWNANRQAIAKAYSERLQGIADLILPWIDPKVTSVFHQFVVRSTKRDKLQAFLHEKEIGTLIHYPIPPHLQKAYAHLTFSKGAFPIAEELSQTALSLPIYPGLSDEEIDYICEQIREFFNRRL